MDECRRYGWVIAIEDLTASGANWTWLQLTHQYSKDLNFNYPNPLPEEFLDSIMRQREFSVVRNAFQMKIDKSVGRLRSSAFTLRLKASIYEEFLNFLDKNSLVDTVSLSWLRDSGTIDGTDHITEILYREGPTTQQLRRHGSAFKAFFAQYGRTES